MATTTAGPAAEVATTTDIPPLPADAALATAGMLDEGPAAIATFLGARGWSLADARPAQDVYRPGRVCTLRYQARARTPAGEPRVLMVCVETARRAVEPPPPPAGFAERYGLVNPVDRVGPYLVWVFPYDPSLVGLFEANQGQEVRSALTAAGSRPAGVAVQPVRYRPRRRAVLRYTALHPGGREVLYGKTLPADKAGRMREVAPAHPAGRRRPSLLRGRRARLRLTLPFADGPGGTLLFTRADGTSLRDLLVNGGALPSPTRLARVFDDLGRALPARLLAPPPARHDVTRLAEHSRRLLHAVVPDARGDVDRVVDDVLGRAAADDNVFGAAPTRLVHGDLYEAQVFVADDFSLGLIDLDDVGPGDPAVDAANFTAHLVALAQSVPRAGDRLLAYRTLARSAFADRLGVSADALSWREALCTLLLATGPFRTLAPDWPADVHRRIMLAGRMAEAANGKVPSS